MPASRLSTLIDGLGPSGRKKHRPAGLLCFALVFALLAVPTVSSAAVQARSADSFVESIGVNVHVAVEGTPYVDRLAAVEQKLKELGVHHVRDSLVSGRPDQYQALEGLAAEGIGSTVILGDPTGGTAGLEDLIEAVKTELSGSVEAVEGPNEFSTSGDANWKPDLIAYQEQLYEKIKGDPALSSLPVIGPSIVHGDQHELGDISGFLDYGNIHSYPEGNAPEFRMGSNVEHAEYNSGAKPIVATETGYTNATNWTPVGPGENKPISEEAAGTYVPRLFFEYFTRHIARTFSYELVDQHPNPGLDEREDHFGLLRNDLSEKPAFVALKNTIDILEDPGPTISPGSLEYTLSAGGPTLHSSLLEKRDGTFYLALWRLESIWNPDEKLPLSAPAEPVTISVDPGVAAYAVYSPTSSSQPVFSASGPTSSLTVDVGAGVAIVELAPEAGLTAASALPAPPAPLPESAPVRRCIVPSLRGRSLRESKRKIRAADCRVGLVKRTKVATAKIGRVVRQRPKPGTVLVPGSKVRVALGA